jgi:putative transposase
VDITTLNWVSWFNHRQLMEGLGYIPPTEAEATHYRQLSEQSVVLN